MASRFFQRAEGLMVKQILLAGSFPFNATSNPASFAGQGITSVTRTGVGSFLVTLSETWPAPISIQPGLQLAAPGTLDLAAGAFTPGSGNAAGSGAGSTLALTVVNTTTGAAQEVAANASNVAHFVVTFNLTQVKPG